MVRTIIDKVLVRFWTILINYCLFCTGQFSVSREETERLSSEKGGKPADFLYVDGEKYAVVG